MSWERLQHRKRAIPDVAVGLIRKEKGFAFRLQLSQQILERMGHKALPYPKMGIDLGRGEHLGFMRVVADKDGSAVSMAKRDGQLIGAPYIIMVCPTEMKADAIHGIQATEISVVDGALTFRVPLQLWRKPRAKLVMITANDHSVWPRSEAGAGGL